MLLAWGVVGLVVAVKRFRWEPPNRWRARHAPHGMCPTARRLILHSARGRIALVATVGASGMAMLDGTVVNVALPHIGADFDASVNALQWVLTGYLLALASLILLGGALGDRFGRRRVFVIGTVWFAGASLLCGAAPNIEVLVAARVLQGVGAALLTPGSLAILQASFRATTAPRRSGAWSGLGGVAGAVGPFLGGWLVDGPGRRPASRRRRVRSRPRHRRAPTTRLRPWPGRLAKLACRIARLPGVSSAAPTPCSTRAPTSTSMFGAAPQSRDATANQTVPITKTLRRPKRSPSAPPRRINDASASR